MGTDVETVELARTLTRLWAEVLGTEDVTADSNFFAFGGDSALGVELTFLIASETGESVSMRLLADAPTPAGLAAALRERAAKRVESG